MAGTAWTHREPRRSDYRTDAEYEEALSYYESALDDYCDRYMEEQWDWDC